MLFLGTGFATYTAWELHSLNPFFRCLHLQSFELKSPRWNQHWGASPEEIPATVHQYNTLSLQQEQFKLLKVRYTKTPSQVTARQQLQWKFTTTNPQHHPVQDKSWICLHQPKKNKAQEWLRHQRGSQSLSSAQPHIRATSSSCSGCCVNIHGSVSLELIIPGKSL